MTATTDTPARKLELLYWPPGSLLLDRNVRLHTSADEDLIESVRSLGVLQPIVAVWATIPDSNGEGDAGGALRVKLGHRRTLAALAAGLNEVPILVAGDEATDDPGEIDRLLVQLAENDARAALTTMDRVNAYEQLAAFGLSTADISQRTRRDVDEVTAALRIGSSQFAADTCAALPQVDLERMADLVEFEDDVELATDLAAKATNATDGQWQHLLQQVRNDRAAVRRREEARVKLAELLGDEKRVIDRPGWDSRVKPLRQLVVSATDRARITPEAHTSCPGHVGYVERESGEWNFTKGEPRWDASDTVVLLPPDVAAPTADDPDDDVDVDACSVCGCNEDDACEVFPDPPEGEEPEGLEDPQPCRWTGTVDPKNPEGLVCSACVDADGNVIEDRRSEPARGVEDVPLPGDEAPKPDVVRYATWFSAGFACLDPAGHGHHDTWASSGRSASRAKAAEMTPQEREEASKERKDVIASNKAWKAATEVRRRWLKTFLTAKTPPPGTGAFMAEMLAAHGASMDRAMSGGSNLAFELLALGAKPPSVYRGAASKLAEAAGKASEARAQVIALAFVLACCEDQTDTNTWRRRFDYEQAYMRFLADCGYELADVEKRVIPGYKPKKAAAAKKATAPARRSRAAKATPA